MAIAEFFNGREIFITGATGFLGKSLFEKLLRSCTGITKIYILIRAKRNKTALERLKELQNELLFERLNRECPNAFEKVIPIIGDCQELGLGISQEDLKLLENVSIIFHEAAYTKFDNDLKGSLLMNTRGTHELVKIALNLKHLISFVHVSTAYVCPEKYDVEEKLYEPPADWRKTIKIAETYDVGTLEAFKHHFTNFSPTVYTFTKNLSEHIIGEYSGRLPMTIIRPAIVSHSYIDPEPGFMDNINGHIGLLVAISIGISPLTYCDPKVNLSMMPVDMVTSLTITAAFERGLETLKSKNAPLTVHNFAPRELFTFTTQQNAKALLLLVDENPMQYTMWAPQSRMTTCFSWYMIWTFLVQIPSAIFVDTMLMLFKKPPLILKTVRRLIYTVKAVSKFSTKQFNFVNDNMWKLFEIMKNNDDNNTFYIANPRDLDHDFIFKGLLFGFKKHIMKEPTEATPATRKRYKTLKYLNEIVKFIIFSIVIRCLWKLVN